MTHSLDGLPGPEAGFRDLVRFAEAHDPTAEFRTRWGTEYASQARELWEKHRAAFAGGAALPSGDSSDELLLCMNYQIAVSPYMAVSPDEVTAFCLWLIGGVRRLTSA